MLGLTKEFMQDAEWLRWRMKEGLVGEGERLAATVFRLVKQIHTGTWFSDNSFQVVRGLSLETGVYWRYSLSKEVMRRMIKSEKGGDGSRLSILS